MLIANPRGHRLRYLLRGWPRSAISPEFGCIVEGGERARDKGCSVRSTVQVFSSMTDLVPQAIRDLLAFYKERYADTRFGDLDVTVLERAVSSIDEAAKAVVQAEEALSAAQADFRDLEVEISQKAVRALSFLKIFVEGDPEPLSKLDLIAAAMPAARRRTRGNADAEAPAGEPRQRRTRKSKHSDEPVVPLGSEVEADADALLTPLIQDQAPTRTVPTAVAAAE